jgi:hypothetical protein
MFVMVTITSYNVFVMVTITSCHVCYGYYN